MVLRRSDLRHIYVDYNVKAHGHIHLEGDWPQFMIKIWKVVSEGFPPNSRVSNDGSIDGHGQLFKPWDVQNSAQNFDYQEVR